VTAAGGRPLRRTHIGLIVAFPVLVLAQAALAGQWLAAFDEGYRVVHGVLGNVTFLVAVANVVLGLVRREGRALQVAAAALLVLVFSQVGLGYSIRSVPELVAWHVPIGVGIFGITTFQLALAVPTFRGARPDR
jgi:hypothetical protein